MSKSWFQPLPKLSVANYLKTPFLLSLLCSSILGFSLLVFYFSLQPVVPMFYSLAQPDDYLVPKIFLLFFPLFSFFITFFHLFLLRIAFREDAVIAQLFAWVSVVIQLLLCLSFMRILFIVW